MVHIAAFAIIHDAMIEAGEEVIVLDNLSTGSAFSQMTKNVIPSFQLVGDKEYGSANYQVIEDLAGNIFAGYTGVINTSFTGNNLTVNQRPVTITADALNKSVGAADPAFSYQVTAGSLANGDVLNLTRAAGQTIGVYPISLGSNPNYSVTYTGNNLSIVAAPAAASSGGTTTTLSGDAMRSVLFSNRPDVLPAGGQDAAPPATVRGNKDGQKPAC